MEKVILIFSFMGIGVNIISGKGASERGGGGCVFAKKANKSHHAQIPESFRQEERRRKGQILLLVPWKYAHVAGFAAFPWSQQRSHKHTRFPAHVW